MPHVKENVNFCLFFFIREFHCRVTDTIVRVVKVCCVSLVGVWLTDSFFFFLQCIILCHAPIVGAMAWQAFAIAVSVVVVTSSVRTASGAETPAAHTTASTRWRSTRPGWVRQRVMTHSAHQGALSVSYPTDGLLQTKTFTYTLLTSKQSVVS